MLNTDLSDPAADSYLSTEQAGEYFALGFSSDAWAAVTNQEAALRSAASWLNTIPWAGVCCTTGRRLSWPRQGVECNCTMATCEFVPEQVKTAQAELALQIGTNPNVLISLGSAVSNKGAIQSQTLGGLSQSFYAPTEATATSTGTAGSSLLLNTFPWLNDILGCWIDKKVGAVSQNRIIARVRS